MRPRYLVIFRFCLIILAEFSINAPIRAAYSQEANTVWGNKPVLAHYLLEPDSAKQLQNDLGLSSGELQRIIHIAREEDAQIQRLEVESEAIIGDPNLTLEQKSS